MPEKQEPQFVSPERKIEASDEKRKSTNSIIAQMLEKDQNGPLEYDLEIG